MPIGRPLSLTANVARKDITATATEGQTQFTVTGGYRINELGVYRNGVRLVNGSDYTATDGSIVTLLCAATAGDVVNFQIFDSFNIADAIDADSSSQTINGALTIKGELSADGGVVGVSTRFTASVGIQSGGTAIGQGVTTINFIGSGNTIGYNASTNTVDVTIAGSGGGGIGTAIEYASGTTSPFKYFDSFIAITENTLLDTSNAGMSTSYVVVIEPTAKINTGVAVTVGVGKTLVIDVLQVGDI